MKIFNQNLTAKEQVLAKKPNPMNISSDYQRLSFDRKSKSYHFEINSKENYLEDNENFNDDCSYYINEHSNEEIFNEKSTTYYHNRKKQKTNDIETLDFNISDDKFLSFLNNYLNYLEKNTSSAANTQSDYEKEALNDNNENYGRLIIQKFINKYKKKCLELESLSKMYYKESNIFKSKEKNLQKVKSFM